MCGEETNMAVPGMMTCNMAWYDDQIDVDIQIVFFFDTLPDERQDVCPHSPRWKRSCPSDWWKSQNHSRPVQRNQQVWIQGSMLVLV